MHFPLLILILAHALITSAAITWKLQKAPNPTADQADAYRRIEKAMTLAVARYRKLAKRPNKAIKVTYTPGVKTADSNIGGNLRFGGNKAFMNERTALHEISHTLGIGLTKTWDRRCKANNWPTAGKLLKTWDGPNAKINCGGQHIWPYGLNYDGEMSETNANRHCQLIDAMLADGLNI
jgi:hypothetical protein